MPRVSATLARRLALSITLVALVAACAPSAGPSSSPSGSGGVPVAVRADVARALVPRSAVDPHLAGRAAPAIAGLGLRLLAELAGAGPNVVLSPTSIALALAMVRLGARHETASELDRLLGGIASDDHAAWLTALDAALMARSGTFPDAAGTPQPILLGIADGAFAQRGMALEASYLEALARRFGAGIRLVDYQGDPEAARRVINAWAAGATRGRVGQILPPGAVTPLSRLTLVNAIYLKAPWLSPFDPSATIVAPFRRDGGSAVAVPTMHAQAILRFGEAAGWQMVEVPYVGGALVMDLVLPPTAAGPVAITDGILDALVAAAEPAEVRLALPRFTAETQVDLDDALASLGVRRLFDPQKADLSGIASREPLYVSTVAHDAWITVDEAGTEAAAATAAVIGTTALPARSVDVRFDRPFVFLLRDRPTGAVLVLGRIGDPSGG